MTSSSVNKVILVGNLGADPEIRLTSTGRKLARISVATNDRWKDEDQNVVEKTEWHKVVISGPKAEIAERYLRKGNLVAIEGAIHNNKWTDNEGNERLTVEVHITQVSGEFTMLGSRNDGGYNSDYSSDGGNSVTPDKLDPGDIPF